MGLNSTEQMKNILSSAKSVLILLPQNPEGDILSAGWSFYFFLKDRDIEPTIAFDDPQNNKDRFSFLPTPENIKGDIFGSRDFILSFDTSRNRIVDIGTEQNEKETRIYITPEHGSIDPRDFSFIPAKFKYDLLVCLGSPDKESFGKIFEENPDIFYEVPIINIDNHNNNDSYGQINIVEMTASSISEILFNLFENFDNSLLNNEKISTCLLTGIISATNSYQNNKTTPRSLQISSRLMQQGVNQQDIVRHLYKTQPFSILKLWGRVMSKLKWDEDLKLVWAVISPEDLAQSRSISRDIPVILEKIQNNYESGNIFMILYKEQDGSIKGNIKFSNTGILKKMDPVEGGKIIGNFYEFETKEPDIRKLEMELIQKIKGALEKNKGVVEE